MVEEVVVKVVAKVVVKVVAEVVVRVVVVRVVKVVRVVRAVRVVKVVDILEEDPKEARREGKVAVDNRVEEVKMDKVVALVRNKTTDLTKMKLKNTLIVMATLLLTSELIFLTLIVQNQSLSKYQSRCRVWALSESYLIGNSKS